MGTPVSLWLPRDNHVGVLVVTQYPWTTTCPIRLPRDNHVFDIDLWNSRVSLEVFVDLEAVVPRVSHDDMPLGGQGDPLGPV